MFFDFTPTDCLHDFGQKLKTKLEESNTGARSSAAIVAATQPASFGSIPELAVAVGSIPVIITCHYCQRPGHTANRCYLKFQEQKRANNVNAIANTLNDTFTRSKSTVSHSKVKIRPSHAAADGSASNYGATGSAKYCALHYRTTPTPLKSVVPLQT